MSTPRYPFLSGPPPVAPLPDPPLSRSPSSNTSAIALWAARVQPGSPGTPSPRRRSYSRRPSLSRSRRPSISHSRVPSASFINFLDTPSSAAKATTPSVKDFTPDLLSLGYTAVFVPLPKRTPTPAHKPLSPSTTSIPVPPIPPSPDQPKSRPLKHFRSLSVLKPIRLRARSKSTTTNTTATTTMPASPKSPTKKTAVKSKAAPAPAPPTTKRNKAKNTHTRPVPLANELEIMQFLGGGSIDSHVKRVMESQARAAAPVHTKKNAVLPVGDVFRDGNGGIWWDQEEVWEYARLLGNDDDNDGDDDDDDDDDDWVRFGDKENTRPAGDDRRGSLSTQSSSLDPRLVVKPSSDDDLAAFGGALPPQVFRKPVSSVLGRGRPRRATVSSVSHSGRPLSPRSTTARFPVSVGASAFAAPIKGKPRRRPAPLKLTPIPHAWKRPSNSPVDAEQVRRDFLQGSFAPAPLKVPAAPVRLRKSSFATLRQAMGAVAATPEARNTRKAGNMWGLFRG